MTSNADILSIQLYSLRKYRDLEAQIDLAARAGFRNVETIGAHYEDAAATRRMLDARGLAAPTGHVSMAMLRERFDWVIEVARTLGLRQLIMPAMPPGERTGNAAFWRGIGTELGAFAHRVAGHGLDLAYHNHDWELAAVEGGRTGLDLLFEGAGDAPLGWQVDIAWLARGGADPFAWLRRPDLRVTSAHVKDLAPAGQNLDEDGWADAGAGTLPWRELWPAARAAGARYMILEHDNPKDFEGFVTRSHAFLSPLPA